MENQVTSIEQSKRLLELGVPAGRAHMMWRPEYTFDDDTREFVPTGNYELVIRHPVYEVAREDVTPAFTVGDLLGMLPARIPDGCLTITRSYYLGITDWIVFYKRGSTSKSSIVSFGGGSLIQLVCNMIEWLVKNGYKLKT